MDVLLSFSAQKVLVGAGKIRSCFSFLIRSPLCKLWKCCSWNNVKAVWEFAVSPGPREVLLKSFAICLITTFATGTQIAAYLLAVLFYNRFCLHSVSRAYKTYFSGWIPAVLPSQHPTILVILQFTILSLLQVNPEFSEIATAFIITFLSHVVVKLTIGCLVALYSLLTARTLDLSLVAEICSRLG